MKKQKSRNQKFIDLELRPATKNAVTAFGFPPILKYDQKPSHEQFDYDRLYADDRSESLKSEITKE